MSQRVEKQLEARVQEEVVKQMARAQTLGMLYREAKEQEREERAQSRNQRTGGERSRGGGDRSSKNPQRSPRRNPSPLVARPSSQTRPSSQQVASTSVVEPTRRGSQRSHESTGGMGTQDGPSTMRTAIRLENVTSMDDFSVEEVLSGVQRLERRHKGLLEQLRTELDSGPPAAKERGANGSGRMHHAISHSLWESLQKNREPLTRAIANLILRDINLAHTKRLPHRLWMAFYKELDSVQQALKRLSSNPPTAQQSSASVQPWRDPQALRLLLYSMIGRAEHELSNLASSLEARTPSSETSAAHFHALQMFVTALGDLARYKQYHRPADEPREWGAAEACYHKAFRLRPAAGKPFMQLALVATLKKDSFAAFYHYLRSLCAKEACQARESILTLHERCKQQLAAVQQEQPRVAGPLPPEEHTHRFLLRLLVAAGTCLSGVELAAFDSHLSAAKLHLVMCLQLQLGAGNDSNTTPAVVNGRFTPPPPPAQKEKERSQRAGSGRGSNRAKSPTTVATSSSNDPVIGPDVMAARDARRRLPAHLLRVMLLAICTVDGCFQGAKERGMAQEQWMEVPAIRNAIRMCFALASAMASAAAAGSRADSAGDWQHAVLPAVCIFLDWLRCQKFLGEGLKAFNPDVFHATMSAIASLCNATNASAAENGDKQKKGFEPVSVDSPLLEDIECQGLLPLKDAIEPRVAGLDSAGAVAKAGERAIDSRIVRIKRLHQFKVWAEEKGWFDEKDHGESCVPDNNVDVDMDGMDQSGDDSGAQEEEHEEEEDFSEAESRSPTLSIPSTQQQPPITKPLPPPVAGGQVGGGWNTSPVAAGSGIDSPEERAVAAALADLGLEETPGGEFTLEEEDDAYRFPEGLLDLVLAGLGSPDERLCSVCCNTLSAGTSLSGVCPFCGTKTASTPNGGAQKQNQSQNQIQAQGAYVHSLRGNGSPVLAPSVPQAAATTVRGMLSVNMDEVYSKAKSPPPGSLIGSRGRNITQSGPASASPVPKPKPPPSEPYLVVVDAPNVAMSHGRNKRFSWRGVKIAIEHFKALGHRVVGFVPAHHLNDRNKSRRRPGGVNGDLQSTPEDQAALQEMVEEGLLATTPSQDYDDSYCISYAMQRNGVVVTNDMFRDHTNAVDGAQKRDNARRWLKGHLISFTFIGDEFVPNPDFVFNG